MIWDKTNGIKILDPAMIIAGSFFLKRFCEIFVILNLIQDLINKKLKRVQLDEDDFNRTSPFHEICRKGFDCAQPDNFIFDLEKLYLLVPRVQFYSLRDP